MMHHPVLINGQWRETSFPVSSFKAVSPLSAKQLKDSFPVSSFLDLDEMLQSHAENFEVIDAIKATQRSELLLLVADKLAEISENLIETAFSETGIEKSWLSEQELIPAIAYLRQTAEFCREEGLGPKISEGNLTFYRSALDGPVVIFGPANSPFLFNSATGVNFATAIAAGNAVIAKGNPNHPLTSLKLAEIVAACIKVLGLPGILFQFFHHTTPDLGFRLAAHPMIGALSFTGNFRAGIMLKENADRAGNLAYLDLHTATPAFLLPGYVSEHKEILAGEISKRVRRISGQSAMRPGPIFLVEDKHSSHLIRSISDSFNRDDSQPMLSDLKARHLDSLLAGFVRFGAKKLTRREFYSPTPFTFPFTSMVVDLKTFLKFSPQFQEYAAGPYLLFVTLESSQQFAEAARSLTGCRCSALFSTTSESENNSILPILSRKSGTVFCNHWPETTVLSAAAISSGPYPATAHPGFSAIGLPQALYRFCALKSRFVTK